MRFFPLVLVLLLCACSTPSASFPKGFENASGQMLLAEGLKKHEAGSFDEALSFFDSAYFRFSEQGDKEKMAETLSARTLTLRRQGKLDEALKALEEAVTLTAGTGGSVLPLYNLAKVQQQVGDPTCVETYQKTLAAMEEFQPTPHYRPAVIQDMRLHIAIAQLHFSTKVGDAESRALEAIKALSEDEELDAFGRMVWVSGGYIGLTRYYIPLDVEIAWLYFDLAEQTILAYPDETVLRRADLENLRTEMPERP